MKVEPTLVTKIDTGMAEFIPNNISIPRDDETLIIELQNETIEEAFMRFSDAIDKIITAYPPAKEIFKQAGIHVK